MAIYDCACPICSLQFVLVKMNPEQYLAYIRKPKSGFANALGALDKLKDFARHFEKAFLKGQTAAAAIFSPGR